VPEILEIEMYRRGAAEIVGRTISAVHAPDEWYLKGIDAPAVGALLTGSAVTGLGRVGKLMLLKTTAGTVGLRFGMTGRLVIDDRAIIEALEYSSKRLDASWVRFSLDFDEGGSLQMNDPRRLGGVSIDPDLDQLGSDVWLADVDRLLELCAATTRAIKALLLDQSRLAGLGNLLVDELLWRTALSPQRAAKSLSNDEIEQLAEAMSTMLEELYLRGGSHMGDHVPHRVAGALCPRDAAPMTHATVGNRSTWSCSMHQR